MSGALFALVARTHITRYNYTEFSESDTYQTNSPITVLCSADTKVLHSIRFLSSFDVHKIKTIFVRDANRILACVPIQLLYDCGFVHIGKQYTVITTPFKLFFKNPSLFPMIACYFNKIEFYVESDEKFDIELLWSLRFLETEPRREMAQNPHYFIGHQIYTDFEKVRNSVVKNIIISSYKIPTTITVNDTIIDNETLSQIMTQIKVCNTIICESILTQNGLDEFTCADIMHHVGNNVVLIPINIVINKLEFNKDFIGYVYYMTDVNITIKDGFCCVANTFL